MWFKVDDTFWAHPKTACLEADAVALWLRAGCWSAQYLTDGFVPLWAIQMLTHGEDFAPVDSPARTLVDAGLWREVEFGYAFHDWDVYQPSADEVREKRRAISEVRAEAGRKGAAARWSDGKNGKPMASPIANGWQTDGPVPVPVPKEQLPRTLDHRSRGDHAFDAFWSAYPRKVGKRTALAAYARACKRANADDILTGLLRQVPAWTDPQYVPHPTTWLNRDGWLDEPTRRASTADMRVGDALALVAYFEQEEHQ